MRSKQCERDCSAEGHNVVGIGPTVEFHIDASEPQSLSIDSYQAAKRLNGIVLHHVIRQASRDHIRTNYTQVAER